MGLKCPKVTQELKEQKNKKQKILVFDFKHFEKEFHA